MSQFLEIIEWQDRDGNEIVHRIPQEGSAETKYGAQLIVRESQAAIFFHAGKGLDVFGPGKHVLRTGNLPFITKVLSLPYGFTSPFRAEVYFVSTRVFANMRWGTKDPVVFRDAQLGLVRLRAFGMFTMQVTQPLLFLNTIVGSRGSLGTQDVEDFLREVVVSRLNDYLGENVSTLFDLPRHYDEMADEVNARLQEDFAKFGLTLRDFLINRITPPEEVQKMLDERTGMAAVGDLDAFLKFRAAKAIGDAATSGALGGGAGSGLGAGIGAGMGMLIPGMLYKSLGSDSRPEEIAERGTVNCPECYADVPLDGRFCPHCGNQMVVMRKCARCGKNVTPTAKFCSACGLDLAAQNVCGSCNTKLPSDTRFCFHCGERVQKELPAAP
ncbi:MAG: SPFH domain-containing protein [Thermoanaerobaculia bacterium]